MARVDREVLPADPQRAWAADLDQRLSKPGGFSGRLPDPPGPTPGSRAARLEAGDQGMQGVRLSAGTGLAPDRQRARRGW